MITLEFGGIKNLLCLGAHSDDIEIGCGATIQKLIQKRPDICVYWIVFGAEGTRAGEAKNSARVFLKGAEKSRILIKTFPNSYFPFQGAAIKDVFESLKTEFNPDLIFTHFRNDRHQDHRVISDFTWNTFRNHLIMEYEIPKYDGDLGSPNVFVQIDGLLAAKKARNLCRLFSTQNNKHWFSKETFLALMRLRGMECCSRYAEAFYCRKMMCD